MFLYEWLMSVLTPLFVVDIVIVPMQIVGQMKEVPRTSVLSADAARLDVVQLPRLMELAVWLWLQQHVVLVT